MKKIIICAFFILAMCGFVSAQTPREILDKVKQIRLLESDRKDVGKILKGYEASGDEDYEQNFSNEIWDIEIFYSKGDCFKDEEEDTEIWNVPEWTVKKIEIIPEDRFKVEDVGYDLSKFVKEQKFKNVESLFVYHNKDSGIAFEVNEDEEEKEITRIFLYPPASNYSTSLCSNEKARKFSAAKSWFGDSTLEDRTIIACYVPIVNRVDLSANVITIGCIDAARNKICSDESGEIEVSTDATDAENDVLSYKYTISGGKIIGTGAKVVWDLTGEKPGTYTITAAADDGCGFCGTTKTETVTVKKCSDCQQK